MKNPYCKICSRILEEEVQYCEITDCPHRDEIDPARKHYRGYFIRIAMLIATAVILSLASCCRPATIYQVQKWEQKHKFEKPLTGAWGIHLFRKKNTYKY